MPMSTKIKTEYTPICDTCGGALPYQALNEEAARKFAASAGWKQTAPDAFICRRCQKISEVTAQ